VKLITSKYETHRHNITKFLNKLCPNGVGAEIGVKEGDFSKILLSGWHGCKLYLIDPWENQDKNIYDEDIHDHESDYHKTQYNLRDFSGRYEIIRQYSNDAHSHFAKNSLDFIYVDGNHSYEGVKSDLELFYPKLKYGGVMMGDDYHAHDIEKLFGFNFGVKKAVDEFCLEIKNNISLNYYGDWYYNVSDTEKIPSRNWMFVK
tara:strand:+ start:584 stop:1192 length:609 start_codon:yes stop_codon:yes gene_type:complete